MLLCARHSVSGAPAQGLAEHKDELGAPLCPCRHYDDKRLEAEQGFWNCPCVPMRERKVSLAPRKSEQCYKTHQHCLLSLNSSLKPTSYNCTRSATACCF